MAVVKRETHRKTIEEVIRGLDIQDFGGPDLQKVEAIRLEEAKISILYWLDAYYSYSIQQFLLQVVHDHKKFEETDPMIFNLLVQQKHLVTRPFDHLNGFVNFNKKIISTLVLAQPQSEFLTENNNLVFNNGYDGDEILVFGHQANRLTFEEFYLNKRKPQKLEEIRQFNSLFLSACGEVFSVSRDPADFEENLLLYYQLQEKSNFLITRYQGFSPGQNSVQLRVQCKRCMLSSPDFNHLCHLQQRKREISKRDRHKRRSRTIRRDQQQRQTHIVVEELATPRNLDV